MKLTKLVAGTYETAGEWAIIKTEWDGPRGGKFFLWERAKKDPYGRGYVIDESSPSRTLREAKRKLEAQVV